MKPSYPWLALGLGLLLGLILVRYGALDPGADNSLPLLTLLLMTEFGFLVTAIAAAVGVRDLVRQGVQLITLLLVIGNVLLAAGFLRLGFSLWPHAVGG